MERVQLLLALSALAGLSTAAKEVETFDFLMPGVHPHRDELYLCTTIRVAPHNSFYIVGFEPNATMHTAHHMLLYGCEQPGATDNAWDCGEMQNDDTDRKFNRASPCKSGSQIIYAWARDAPSLKLPEGVGFLVGHDSPIKYMVLQVHYMHKFPENEIDHSGLFLKFTKEKQSRQAGVFLLGTSGSIPAGHDEHLETACTMDEDKVIHPFAFRTHTHGLGKVVSGYVVRRNERGDEWRLLGKRDPQTPQMFYNVEDSTPVGRGDVLAARCTMHNDRDHTVKIGATNADEMCNFYLMYYVETGTPLERKYCFSPGAPYYYWSRAQQNFNRIPDREASIL